MIPGNPAGVYVHVPFCVKKCRYCDFCSIADLSLAADYLDAVALEIDRGAGGGIPVDTVYVGGGTPSLLKPAGVGHILERVSAAFAVAADAEVTIEVNPGTVGGDDFKAYADAGVNRLSIGVQSFRDSALSFLGRMHSAADAVSALEGGRAAGFRNLGIDLIYALPGQSGQQWAEDLDTALSFAPEHISCYMLTIEPGTPLSVDVARGTVSPLDEAAAGRMFRQTRRSLQNAGYVHYEISNFARTADVIARHNRKYWAGAPYYGFGPSAHSFSPPLRRWNVTDVARYVNAIATGGSVVAGEERLTRSQEMMEAVMLGLRQIAGIDIARFESVFDIDFMKRFGPVIDTPHMRALLAVADGRCALTEDGMVVMDAVVERLVERI